MRVIRVSKRDYNRITKGGELKSASLVGLMRGDTIEVDCISTEQTAIGTVISVAYERDSAGFGAVGIYRLGFDNVAHV